MPDKPGVLRDNMSNLLDKILLRGIWPVQAQVLKKTLSSWLPLYRLRLPMPSVVDRRWIEEQLNGLDDLTRVRGPEAVTDFLERILGNHEARVDWRLRARLLLALEARLSQMTPPDEARLRSCWRQMESCLRQQSNGQTAPSLKEGEHAENILWLTLRGASTRLGSRFRNSKKEARRDDLSRANELLAKSIRDPVNVSALIDAGEAYLKAGRFKLGESCLQRASSQDPKDGGRSAFLLGQCAFHLDDYDNAARAFERAITMGWAQGDIINWQAAAFYEIDKYEEAELCAQKGLEQTDEKSKSLLLSLLGKVHLQRQSLEEAERWFAEGLSADPLCPDVQYGLGLCAIGRGDHDAACGFFEKLLERPDGKPLGHLGLGILCSGRGDTLLAIQHLSEAIRHFPAHAYARACLAECLFDAGRFSEAAKHFALAQKWGIKQFSLLLHGGFAALATGDLESACTLLSEYREADVGDQKIDVTSYIIYALVQREKDAIERGNFKAALAYAEEHHRLVPSDATVAQRLGFLLYSAARDQISKGQVETKTFEMFARARELCKTDATLAGYLAERILCQGNAPIDDVLATLDAGETDSAFVTLLRFLLAYRRRDAAAVENISGKDLPDNPLIAKVQRFIAMQLKVTNGNRKKFTAEEMNELLEVVSTPEFKQVFSAQREAANVLLASLLFEAQGRTCADRVFKTIEDLAGRDRSGFWDEALVFAQLLNASRSNALVAECRNLKTLCREMNVSDKPLISDLHMRAESAEIAKLLEVSDFSHAYEILSVRIREGRADPLSKKLAEAIEAFLSTDSLEAAHLAKEFKDHKRAREIWEALVRKGDTNATDAAHQMAASLFQQGYDEALKDSKQAVQTLSAALPYWKIVYEGEAYWKKQEEKCQALHTNKYPYNSHSLKQIREELPLQALAVLVELGIQCARAGSRSDAAECVAKILDSPFGRDLGRKSLEELFAPALLAKGALNGSDPSRFEQALQSAELVLDCDRENRGALGFALEAAYSQSEEVRLRPQWARTALLLFSRTKARLQNIREEWLKGDAQLASHCKVYWREFASMLELALNQAIADHNAEQSESNRYKFLQEGRLYVDCALNHVLAACEQWGIRAEEYKERFESVDSTLRELNFPRNSSAEF